MVGGYPSEMIEENKPEPLYEDQIYLLHRVNATRAKYGLNPVMLLPPLSCAARAWSKRIWRLKVCTHVDPETGQQFWQRVQICEGQLTQGWEIVGCGYPDIDSVIQGWLSSPPHRNILLSPSIRLIGIGFAGPAVKGSQRYYTIIATP